MVLSKSDIFSRLASDSLIITPLLDANTQIGEASVDLRLGREFIVTKHTRISSLDPVQRTSIERTLPLYQEKLKLDFGRPYILHPQELVLASTLEFVALPRDLMAYVVGRSSWGRLGLIIATATMVDPLYRGVITLEVVNVGRIPIHLYPCARIAQLVLHDVPNGPRSSDVEHKYQDSFEPSFSRVHLDKDLSRLTDQPFQFAIGLTGLRGAGKSEVINHLTTEKDFRLFNISDIVRFEAKTQGYHLDRKTLQDYGDARRKRDDLEHRNDKHHIPGSYFAARILEAIAEKCSPTDKFLIVTGIRNTGEARYLQSVIRNFFLVAVTAKPDARYKRRVDDGDYEERTEFDKADLRDMGDESNPSGQDVGGCIRMARSSENEHGFIIENDESEKKGNLRDAVEEILREISSRLA